MSIAKKLMTVGAEKDVYVDDVFSTYLYTGTGSTQSIVNGINLGDFGGGTSTKFDGESDYLSRSSDFVGNSDSAAVTISFWAFLAKEDIQARVYSVGSTYVTLDPGAQVDGAMLNVYLNDGLGSAGSNQFSLRTLDRLDIPYGQWNHILVSLHKQTGQYSIYVNDTAVPSAQIANEFTNNNLADFTQSTHTVMAQNNGTVEGKGKFAHLYMDYTYRDLSNYLNRRPFITVDGGSTPPSTLAALSPIMYLPMVSGYAVGENLGTGGDFDVNGSPEIVDAGTEYVAGSGEGGLVWIKRRDDGSLHILTDTERGPGKVLWSNEADYERDEPTYLNAFNSNGFSLGPGGDVNASGDYVSWTFRKAPKFFDVVTYTGNNSAPTTVPHGLGVKPGMIIIKSIDSVSNWFVWHKDFALSSATGHYHQWCALNLTEAQGTVRGAGLTGEPTAESFTVSNGSGVVGAEQDYVAYVFAHDDSDESLIKCGSYTGNGLLDGPEIDLGFEPQWILVKGITSGGAYDWRLHDTMRGWQADGTGKKLEPNTSAEEDPNECRLALLPTGFKVISNAAVVNGLDEEYIYMAIRRPNKPAEEFEPEELFAVHASTGTSTDKKINTGFPVDLGIFSRTTGGVVGKVFDRLRGGSKQLATPSNGDEYTANGSVQFDDNLGITVAGNMSGVNHSGTPLIDFYWRRSPGFFDVVCYEGDGQAGREVPHNLGVAPEMMWVKNRTSGVDWKVRLPSILSDVDLILNSDKEKGGDTTIGNFTESSFTLYSSSNFSNKSGENYIAYLFASVPGISKVGSYTGTGSTVLEIDCGFTSGARFVLIKRTDAAGDWSVFDTERGISVTQDPRLALNTIDAQETGFSYVNPTASGFSVVPLGANSQNLNQGGAEYIYYAIA